MSDHKHTTERPSESLLETQAQIDPLMSEGPAPRWRIWAVMVFMACVAAVVFYGLSPPTPHLYGPRAVPLELK
jgi:hypothetical protein